ncbi:MAG TPA: response regulator [Smithellaceae bacterium]|nr:response regulator [Smithellaceae bacterium]
MENQPLYNSAIIKTYIDYLEARYPDVNVSDALQFANINSYELTDRGHWLTQTQVNRFHEYLQKATGNEQIAREAGRFTASPQTPVAGMFRQLVAGILTLPMAYWAVEKISASLSRHITLRSKALASNKIEIIATPRENIKEEKFQCDNRLGMFEAISQLYNNRFAVIDHPECIHRGDPHCRYLISLAAPSSLIWKRIGFYMLAATLLAMFPLLYALRLEIWLIAILSSLLASTLPLMYGAFAHDRELSLILSEQGKTSDEVVNQINLRYNESQMIREIGEAASSILDPQELLSFITETLHKRMRFSRSIVMLANPERTKLLYAAGHGYTPYEEALLTNLQFNLTNKSSKGFFYQAFANHKPFFVDNVAEYEGDLSDRSLRVVKDLGVRSFICVPILYKGESEGILAVDNTQVKTPTTQSDLSLLMGVAQQIGICLNTAVSHKKLQESEERFRNLSDNSPDMIYQLDQKGFIKYANPAWEEILGYQPDDLIGGRLSDFLVEEDRPAFFAACDDILLRKNRIRDKNFTLLNSKKLPRYVTLTGAPDHDSDGKVIGIVGTLKDLSRIRSMEAQLLQASKMEAVGTLTGGIAHDFNNIIQAIMGYNQLMISGRLGHETDIPYLNSIGELITRSRELVRQLLLFSKKVEPVSRVLNINDEINSMRNLLVKSIPKMIEIETDLAEDLLPIHADSTQIGQIFMNLVINSRDAMGESGRIQIKTRNLILRNKTLLAGAALEPGQYIQMVVSDTGCGMEKDVIARIFEPFFTTKETGKGTGLGLSVVHGIVKNHEGIIFCESEPDRGTTFTTILPASNASAPARKSPDDGKTIQQTSVSGTERILLVDDEHSILETGRDALSLHGYQVMTAESGEQALDLYLEQKDRIDLVILDLIMPGGGGKKCLLDLKTVNPEVKVLMTSGYANSQQTDDLMAAGASGFLLKPYRPEDLLFMIRQTLCRT